MTVRIKVLFSLIVLFSINALQAQKDVTGVFGIVEFKATKQPVEFATVQLLNNTDSAVISSAYSDKKGKFSIQNVAPGTYLLRTSFIGYESSDMQVQIVDQQKLNIGTIGIINASKSLDDVVVTGRKSVLNTSIDRKVYNVSQDIMALSGNASDILKNIPSVDVDIDGNVSLRGSGDVMILINGRPSPLMGKSRAEVLQQFPANSIERIEVITNPSARYRPDGTAGIINIVLKKNVNGGWNGSATVNAGNRDRYNGGITLNYKPGKLNVFGNYNIRQDQRIRTNDINREYFDSLGKTDSYYSEYNQSSPRPISHLATGGADYTFNERNEAGISFNYSNRTQVKNDVVEKHFYDKNYVLTENYNRLRHDPETEIEKNATLYWQHNFKSDEHTLRAEFNASASDEVEDNHYTDVYFYPKSDSNFDNTLIKQGDHQQQFTLDYSTQIAEDIKLEAGYSGMFTQLDMNFYGEYYDTAQGIFIKDLTKSNQFLYNESIHALYVTFQQSIKKFGYSIGLRAEEALLKENLVTKDSIINNSYFKIYPTLHLSYQLNNGELQLNYSKRVNRAEGDDLNPFPEYRDPRNLQAGNPNLLPEIIHSIEMGYKWQSKYFSFVPSIYYRYKTNGFTVVTIPINDSTLLTTQQNLSTDQSTGLELIFSSNAGKFFSANLSSNIFYNKIDATDLGYGNKKSIISMNTNFNSTFNISHSTRMQVSCNYRSARLTPQGKVYPTVVINAGIRQDLLNKKMSILLTASDIFKTLKQKNELSTPYLAQTAIGRRDAQIIYLGVNYRFGKAIKKKTEEKMQFDNSL